MAFYKITVEPEQLRSMATSVSSYRMSHGQNMHELNGKVAMLESKEEGAEFSAFQEKWRAIVGQGASSQKMLSCLGNYEDFLNYAARQYEILQNNAAIRASWV